MLRGVVYSEVDLKKAARSENSLFGQEGSGLGEAEQEILNFVQSQARNGVNVSAKYLKERFSSKPYGWPEIAVFCVAASLVGKGKVEVRSDGVIKEGDDLVSALQNNRLIENLLFTPQTEFTSAQLRKAKDLYKELFDAPADGSDARSLGAEWSSSVAEMVEEIKSLTQRDAQYPFTKSLKPLQAKLQAMSDKPASWFITEVVAQEDDLLNDKEDLLDKIRSFMGGSQRAIFDDVQQFLTAQLSNIEYVDGDAAKQLREVIEDPNCFKGSAVQNLKSDFYALKDKVELQLLNERKAVQAAVADIEVKVANLSEYADLLDEAKSQVSDAIASRKVGLDNITLIPALRDRKNSIQNDLFADMLALIERLKPVPVEPEPQVTPSDKGKTGPVPTPPHTPPPPAPKIIKASEVRIDFNAPYLADEADVDRYVEELKKSLIAEIRDGKKVVV
ncbi:hypothetical protein [Shimia thalassica]|uniref:hypothetical protein n=1 Tax=Shimia thalassica TaxID=1715693 RepID=UPI0026E268DF|nr:hypothetical protein [Shimia thalassica]MDO6479831.1 hypothetical protein [Shimia thalassica]